MAKTKFCIGTHLRLEYKWAYSARQALWRVWNEYKRYCCKVSWDQAVDGWKVSAVDS